MGMIRKIIILATLICLLTICTSCMGFQTADIALYDIELTEVYASTGAAYYLAKDGTLYCTGADADAASFVVYKNKKDGIVAHGVSLFFEIVSGGGYIDRNGNLYMWCKEERELWGYNEKEKHVMVLENVAWAETDMYALVYIDKSGNLYLAGRFGTEEYSVDSPKFLSSNVSCASVYGKTVIWAKNDGTVECYGNADVEMIKTFNEKSEGKNVSDIQLTKHYAGILFDNQLWYYGDYSWLTTGSQSHKTEMKCLSTNADEVSWSDRTIMAKSTVSEALLWGRCASNDEQNTKEKQMDYYEAICLAENAESVFVSDSTACFIDKNGKSNIFYADGWIGFYGNSTNDRNVGINREPAKWINPNT